MFGRWKGTTPEPKGTVEKKEETSLEDSIFNMKFTAKQLGRFSKKAEAEVEKEKKKCKMAMEKGNTEGARIHAESAIRNKNQALNYLKLEARLNAVVSRLEEKQKMDMVTGDMMSVTRMLGKALEGMDITTISKTMDTFEKQMEDLDIHTATMSGAIEQTTSTTMPVDQVNDLMAQVADEHQLGVWDKMTGTVIPQGGKQPVSTNDDLEARLAKLNAPK